MPTHNDRGDELHEGDVARQAELVVMEYLKSQRFSRTLDAMMSHSSAVSKPSAVASDLYAEDLDRKKKAGATSVLEYIVQELDREASSKPEETKSKRLDSTLSKSTSHSHRKSSVDDHEKSTVEWSKEEVSLLKKAIKQTSGVDDKNERWKQIARLVGKGKSKKHCYLKYKELKEEKNASRASSGDEKSTSRRSSLSEGKGSSRKSSRSESSRDDPLKSSNWSSDKSVRAAKEEPAMVRVEFAASKPRLIEPKQCDEELSMEDCEDFDVAPIAPMPRSMTQQTNNRMPLPGAPKNKSASSLNGRGPSAEELDGLRALVFPGERKMFSSHWEQQGFFFSRSQDLGYGLIQNGGGPCGVLAVVQAFVLRFLLDAVKPNDWRNPTQREQEDALVLALSHILWQAVRASQQTQCILVLNDSKTSSASSLGRRFMSGMQLFEVRSPDQTQSLLQQHIQQYTSPKGNGLVLLVLSVLLSKGIGNIKPEMDSVESALGGGGKLIGGHDYCTQELVNLLLCGVASSNVFNGKQLLEGTSEDDQNAVVLKGIPSRGVVGFLSLFEAYEYIVVGSHLKKPQFNIWVVCSESHYSVFFANPKLLTSDAIHDQMRSLDVFYFDGLGHQEEEIRLTVDAFALPERLKPKPGDLTPPLNLVLQTKWPLARIDWNGVEPHL